MEKIKYILGFMVKSLVRVVKLSAAFIVLVAKVMLILTFAIFKITFGLIRVAEYN